MIENKSVKKGKLFLLSGPSGVGKKTLMDRILKYSGLNLIISISFTTRQKRFNEVDGVDYFFISKEEFKKKIEANQMLEWAYFFDNYYGTSKQWVEERINSGINVLLEIETQGFFQIKEKLPKVFSIFVLPPSLQELERRIRNRGTDSDEHIKIRLEKAEKEIKESVFFSKSLVNEDLEVTTNELKNILLEEINREN